jgi:hypothetical protein
MGQKVHPIGLRVGIYRKWCNTWYTNNNEYKNFFFNQNKVEDFIKAFFHSYAYTKVSFIKNVNLVDIKFFKSGLRHIYVFVFFYKFRVKKRKVISKYLKK